MMRAGKPVFAIAVLGLLASTALTACAPSKASAPEAEPTTPAATVTVAPTREPGEKPTCDNLVSPEVADKLAATGWSARSDPLFIISTEVKDGVQCTWGDFSGAINSNVQIFGYGPLTPEEEAAAEQELQAAGWKRDEDSRGVYYSQPDSMPRASDADEYGWTYLFGNGWVTYSDTRLGLSLIAWP